MKTLVTSDLHIDTYDFDKSYVAHWVNFDVVCLVGDIANDIMLTEWFLRYAAETFPNTTILFVSGNHDFYNTDIVSVNAMLKDVVNSFTNFHHLRVLEDGTCITHTIGDTVFIGDTLWTDFELNGASAEYYMQRCWSRMNDYRAICVAPVTDPYIANLHSKVKLGQATHMQALEVERHLRGQKLLLTPMATLAMHWHQRTNLFAKALELKAEGKKVVMLTHHLPDPTSCDTRYAAYDIDQAYASNLLDENRGIDYWFHGHSHRDSDYVKNGTRVIANPNGYNKPTRQNLMFTLEI